MDRLDNSSEVFAFLFVAKCFYTIFAIVSAFGVVCNSILLFTTIRSTSLRAPCNILIGSCVLFDVVHQFVPEMGVAAGSFAVLSIGIDRFLSISMPSLYSKIKVSRYLSAQYLAITICCAYNTFLMFYFYKDQ